MTAIALFFILKKGAPLAFRLHELRHSHASLLIEMGFSPLAIAERLGHDRVETTMNTYAHLYPNKQKQLAEKLNEEYKRVEVSKE